LSLRVPVSKVNQCEQPVLKTRLGALQTLVHFLTQLAAYEKQDQASIYAEIVDILDTLCDIDSDRKLRYKDLSE